MIAANLSEIYRQLRQMGVVRSKRDFSANLLGRNRAYLKNLEARCPLTVRPIVIQTLRARLAEIKKFCPPEIRAQIAGVIARIDQDCRVAKLLGWR
jgi:hypothetical protein